MPKFKLFFVIFSLTLTAVCYGQSQPASESEHEISLWFRNSTPFPWYFYTGKFTADLRFNLDQDKTGAACFGKSFGNEKLSVVPEACGYVGLYNGYGPEVWIFSDTKGYSVTSYIQYAKFLDTSSFGYAWFQAGRKIGHNVELGVGGQVLKEKYSPFEADFGPAANFKIGKFTLSLVPLFRTNKEDRGKLTFFTGVAYVF